MKTRSVVIFFVLISLFIFRCSNQVSDTQDWTHFTRIAGHGLNMGNISNIIKDAKETHLFGIEVDNDIPGRYDSFLNPDKKLEAIRIMAEKAHKPSLNPSSL